MLIEFCIYRIIRHNLDPKVRDVIKIVAFAGTGKTTTLINLCKENPNLKFLVVMYNRKDLHKNSDQLFCRVAQTKSVVQKKSTVGK